MNEIQKMYIFCLVCFILATAVIIKHLYGEYKISRYSRTKKQMIDIVRTYLENDNFVVVLSLDLKTNGITILETGENDFSYIVAEILSDNAELAHQVGDIMKEISEFRKTNIPTK
jgi:hypothetical protein